MTDESWIDQDKTKSYKFLLERMAGGRMAVYIKKFEILQKETANSTMLIDCVPVIMDLITCDLNVDKALRQSLLRSLVQMVVSSENVVQKLSAAWKTDVLLGNLVRVMREHVLTQYKHYQLYTHNVVTVMKCLAQVMKNNKVKENKLIQTTYLVGKDSCTMLDVLLKPMQYLVNMNKMFNDLGLLLLNTEDTDYVGEIKRYLTQVFNKIQSKLDLVSEIIDQIVKRYEKRCEKNKSADEKWKNLKEKLRKMFEATIVAPCSFTFNLYLNYYFPNEEHVNEYLNTLIKT
ncbi:uncharacterized protein LOC100165382 [Acyrthosiphon pisum]|uniref:Uncharacterized protein n=1 Tax=Acyrthosiphon pisum TaxID=7029 RepID=A0A8R2D6W1_ACYPI|nr:uncharacterized protein LOC100165382 [Acyrthosiphon pisum]XP_016662210.1 uncharacterized protein LOC100165382 [Acyrthosiphon pisum]|eukprot:XP_001946752.1 PREDICTED: uncharacterized protein LOC100165382 [Acyrthosiphon pisum]